jgi:hypothetical protein
VVGAELLALENRLNDLQLLTKITVLQDLKDLWQTSGGVTVAPCDLLLISTTLADDEQFTTWLKALSQKIKKQGMIWIPALIVSKADFKLVQAVFEQATEDNWYFDIVHPDQMSSLPIRVANLLRIHDHLHEMLRYQGALDDLAQRVSKLESELKGRLKKP